MPVVDVTDVEAKGNERCGDCDCDCGCVCIRLGLSDSDRPNDDGACGVFAIPDSSDDCPSKLGDCSLDGATGLMLSGVLAVEISVICGTTAVGMGVCTLCTGVWATLLPVASVPVMAVSACSCEEPSDELLAGLCARAPMV